VPALHVRADGHDLAGDLQAGNVRCAGRRRVLALPLHEVGTSAPSGGIGRETGVSTSGAPGVRISMAVIV
jgi:hypothetical protein